MSRGPRVGELFVAIDAFVSLFFLCLPRLKAALEAEQVLDLAFVTERDPKDEGYDVMVVVVTSTASTTGRSLADVKASTSMVDSFRSFKG